MNDIKSRCVSIFSKIMEVPSDMINEDTDPGNLSQWDSLSHVQLIAGLEKDFSIEITPEEGIDLESFKMVLNFIEKKLK